MKAPHSREPAGEKTEDSELSFLLCNIFGHILAHLSCAGGQIRGSFPSIVHVNFRVKAASWSQGGKTQRGMKFWRMGRAHFEEALPRQLVEP